MTRRRWVCAATTGCVLAIGFCAAVATRAVAESASVAEPVVGLEAKAQKIIEKHCLTCHDKKRWEGKAYTAQQWQANINRMIGKGAKLNTEEVEILIEWKKQK